MGSSFLTTTEPETPALGAQGLSHWATSEVPMLSSRGEANGNPNRREKSRHIFFKLTRWYVKLRSQVVSANKQMLALNYYMELFSSYKSYQHPPPQETFKVW